MALHAAVTLVRESEIPLTAQIQRFLKKEVTEGTLHPGTRLPSSRRLADDLGVSRSVVVEAYGQLVAEGYLEAVQGAGTRVVRHLDRAVPGPPVPSLLDDGHAGRRDPAVRWDLRPGAATYPTSPAANGSPPTSGPCTPPTRPPSTTRRSPETRGCASNSPATWAGCAGCAARPPRSW